MLDFRTKGLSSQVLVECIMSQVKLNARGDTPDGFSLALLTLEKTAEVKS